MKPEFNRKYTTIAAYVLIVALILVTYILLFVFWDEANAAFTKILDTLSPFFYGFAIAYVLNPIYEMCRRRYILWFCQKKKHSEKAIKAFSLLATYIIAFVFLALFFYIIIPQLWQSFVKLRDSFPTYIAAVENILEIRFSDISLLPSNSPFDTAADGQAGLVNMLEGVYDAITQVTPRLINIITNFATHVWNFILGFIISIYMLADKKRFSYQFKKLLYAFLKKDKADNVVYGINKAHTTFGGFISGKIVDSFIIGMLCFVGMSILRIPYTPLVSVVVGVTNVIPYFGPFLGAIPSIFIILLENPVKAVWFAIFILILQQLDGNVIGPKIIGEKIGLSSFWVIFALLIIGSLLGVLGLLLAVPIFAMVYDFIKYLCDRTLAKKGYDIEKSDFFNTNDDTDSPPEESVN